MPSTIDIPKVSYLIAETQAFANARKKLEQQGERQFAPVHALEHPDEPVQGTEEAYENTMRQHPHLNSQAFAGIDTTVINPRDAKTKFDNERNKQNAEKQLRLGLAPGYQPKFNPKPSI